MKIDPIFIGLFILILLIFAIYFALAKGDKRRLTLIDAEGSEIQLDVEVADNLTTRAKGLMGRRSLGEYEGMLFVFDKPSFYGFWMLNTTVPLDAIYVSENGSVVHVNEMEPCNILDCRLYYPKKPALYVLEVNRGFSKEHNIIPGKSTMVLPEEYQ